MFQTPLFTEFLKISQMMTVVTLILLTLCFIIVNLIERYKFSFSIRMLIALFLGVGLGILIQAIEGFPSIEIIKSKVWIQETITWYGLFGTAFIGFIRMLIFPIIIVSMIQVILNLKEGLNISVLVKKTLFCLLATTGISSILGIALSLSVDLGSTIVVADISGRSARKILTIVEVILNLVPSNPVQSIVDNNVIAIVIFSSLIGSAARLMRSKEKYKATLDAFADGIQALYYIVMSMAMTIIKFMPYAIVALMANTLISHGLGAMKDALLFIILAYIACAIMLIIDMIIVMLNGLNPFVFVKKCFPVFLMAFSSRSSISTLPMTISTLEYKLGVNPSTASFVGSLGTTLGMNGCSGFFPAMVAIMVSNMLGNPIDISLIVMIVVLCILGSLGVAGIPGAAIMSASIMMSGLGLSQHFGLLAIVFAVDPIIDMGRTMINVAGAMTASICVDRQLGQLNEDIYNDETNNPGDYL